MTVGLPFFDEERDLAQAIHSILDQTFSDFELLLIDDGSTDGSLRIAESFDDPRITVFSDGEHRGLPARLNEIVRRARGSFVARMDADDVAHPRRLEAELALFDREPLDVVGTWGAFVDEAERIVGVVEAAPLPPSPEVALERGVLVHASIVGRRAWFLERPYDESLTRAEDRDLFCMSVRDSRFGVVREPLYVIRVRPNEEGFLADYLVAQRQNRALYLRHGPRAVGLPRTLSLWVKAHAKGLAMQIAVRANLASRIVARRGRPPTDHEAKLVQDALAAARTYRA